jgi:hypothetical protein
MTTSTSAAAKFCQLERRRKFGDEDLGPLKCGGLRERRLLELAGCRAEAIQKPEL